MNRFLLKPLLGLTVFCSVAASVPALDFGTVDVLHPYSDTIVVDQGDEFWLTRPTNPTPSVVEVDMGDGTSGMPIKPGEKVPVRFDRSGKYLLVVSVDGYPERTLTVDVMAKASAPEPSRGVRLMASASATGQWVSMGSLYAGWYSNACGSTGYKFPLRMVANFSGYATVKSYGTGGTTVWSGNVTNGDNIIVVNNPSGALWVLFVYDGSGNGVSGSQTLSTNTPYRLGVTNIVVTTNTLTHTAGTPLATLQTQALVNDPVTWKVDPNCWWTYTNACADLFLWSGTNLAASGLVNGAAYTNAGIYPVKAFVNIDPTGAQADVAVLDLDTLTLTDNANPTNTISDSTSDPLTPATNTLFLSNAGGVATMALNLTWVPSAVSYSGSKFKWMIEAKGGGPASGWSSTSGIANGSPVTLTWSAGTQYQYQVIGWIDRDDNGTTNSVEEQRRLYVDMLSVSYNLDHVCTVGVHAAHQVTVIVSPDTSPLPITLELVRATTTGSGAAIFTNSGASTITIVSSTNLTIIGTQGSDTVSNMTMRATAGGSVITQAQFTVFDIERLDAWDNPHPTNIVSDTDLADTNNPTLYVCQQSNNTAKMTFSISGGLPKAGQHFNWRIIRQNGQPTTQWTPNQGVADTNAITCLWAPPAGGPTNRWFFLDTWYDCNTNPGPDSDEPHRRIGIEVVDVTALTLRDPSSSRKVVDTTRADEPLSTNNVLLVAERKSGLAQVRMTLDWVSPFVPGAKFRYEVVLTNGQPTTQWTPASTGDWSAMPVVLTWTNALDLNGRTNRLFIARGWYDCNQNGTFDEEEPHRQAYIAVVGAKYAVKDICTNGLHSSHDFAVDIEPEIPGVEVQMVVAKAGGSMGSAVFTANGSNTLTIAADTNLTLRGILHSGVESNMMVRAFFAGQMLGDEGFTIRDMNDLQARRAFGPSPTITDASQAQLPLTVLYLDQGTNTSIDVGFRTRVWPNNRYTTNNWSALVLTNSPAFPPANEWNPDKTNTQAGVQGSRWTQPTAATTNRCFLLRSWYDCDGDGHMGTNEPQREIGISIPRVQILNAGTTPTNSLKVGKWENAFLPGWTVRDNFIDLDPDRFYVRVEDESKKGAAKVSVNLSTDSPGTGYDDNPTEVELIEAPANSGVFLSTNMVLVSDDTDDDFTNLNVPVDDTKNDRTHKVAMGGRMAVRYPNTGVLMAQTEATVPPVSRRIDVNIVVLRNRPLSAGGTPVIAVTTVSNFWVIARERYAQIGVDIRWSGPMIVDPPPGVDLSDGLLLMTSVTSTVLAAETRTMIGALGTTNTTADIHAFYVTDVMVGAGPVGGVAVAPFFFTADGPYTYNIILCNATLSPWGGYAAAHELTHLTTNAGHPTTDTWRLMQGAVLTTTGVTGSRRLTGAEETTIRGDSHVY